MCSWHTCQTLLFTLTGSQSPANYPVLVVCCQGYCNARCTAHCPSETCTNTTWLQQKTVAVIKGLFCSSSSSSSVGLTMAKADSINPQVGAPKSLTPPDLPGTKLLKGHYCSLPADSKTGTMKACFSLLQRIFPSLPLLKECDYGSKKKSLLLLYKWSAAICFNVQYVCASVEHI